MSQIKKTNVARIYASGAAVAACALLFPIINIPSLIVMAAAGAGTFFGSGYIFKDKIIETPNTDFAKTGSKDVNSALDLGREFIKEMYKHAHEIDNDVFSTQVRDIIADSEQIFDFLSKNPESMKKLTNFIDYYIPQTLKIIKTYSELKQINSSGKDISGTILKIEEGMPSIVDAIDAQLDSLYSEKAFDIRTDIKVFELELKDKIERR